MKIINFIYNEHTVNFEPTKNDSVMVNATQMAKVFGKDLYQFTKSDNTKGYINACLKPANAGLLSIEKEEDLIISKQKSGTWMHRVLALKFAAWLSPDFEVWVFSTMDEIILGHYKAIQKTTIEKVKTEKKLEAMEKELLKNNPEFEKFLELKGQLTAEDRKRFKAIKEALNQTRMDFD